MARYDLTEFEWKVIQPLLPNKPRGVSRVDDRRVLNGIFYILRSGSPWADVPERYGPPTTVYNRFNRWRKAGVWDRLMDAIIAAHDGK
jgi:transposase